MYKEPLTHKLLYFELLVSDKTFLKLSVLDKID